MKFSFVIMLAKMNLLAITMLTPMRTAAATYLKIVQVLMKQWSNFNPAKLDVL